MDKILTIIIPTYNMEKYLHRCLESLIVSNKTMELLEVLVINDGSKDTSSQIAHKYADKYPQTIIVVDKENGNYGSCINRGLEELTGKYVKILDADDYFDKNVLESYIHFLSTTDVDMILTNYNMVNEKGKTVRQFLFPYPNKRIFKIADYCTSNAFIKIEMHAVTYKRSLLIKHKYSQTTGVSYTDQEWIFTPVTFMDTFCYYDSFLYQYLVGRAGQTIDVNVSSKLVNVNFYLIYKRIEKYNMILSDTTMDSRKKEYLKNRLLHSCYRMYQAALIKMQFSDKLLNEFEEEIKLRNKSLYNEIAVSELCKFGKINFIKYWRNKEEFPFYFLMLRKIYNFVKR